MTENNVILECKHLMNPKTCISCEHENLDGVEFWLHLIKRYNMTPREALQSMQDHGKDVAKVLIYVEDILNAFTINLKGE